MDRAWRGAEAYHFWMLIHRQLYEGDTKAALRTALNMRRYDDVLPVSDIYTMLALVAFHGGYFGQCSKAFMKLESLPDDGVHDREALSELATSIFALQPPVVRSLHLLLGAGSIQGPAGLLGLSPAQHVLYWGVHLPHRDSLRVCTRLSAARPDHSSSAYRGLGHC